VSSFWRPGGLLFSGVVLPSTGFSKKNPPSFDGGWPQRLRAWPVCGCYEAAGRVGLEPLQIPGRSGRLRTEDLEIHMSSSQIYVIIVYTGMKTRIFLTYK